jgi:hypothetical protein
MPAAGSTRIEASFASIVRSTADEAAAPLRASTSANSAGPDVSQRHRSCVMLTDIALWFILVGMFALMPIGCIMTRPPKHTDHA